MQMRRRAFLAVAALLGMATGKAKPARVVYSNTYSNIY